MKQNSVMLTKCITCGSRVLLHFTCSQRVIRCICCMPKQCKSSRKVTPTRFRTTHFVQLNRTSSNATPPINQLRGSALEPHGSTQNERNPSPPLVWRRRAGDGYNYLVNQQCWHPTRAPERVRALACAITHMLATGARLNDPLIICCVNIGVCVCTRVHVLMCTKAVEAHTFACSRLI